MREWNFVTTYAQALLLVAKYPSVTIKEMVYLIGTTRSMARKIMADLVAEGHVSKNKDGREFRYQINPNMLLSEEKRNDIEICKYLDSLFNRKKSIQRD